jgi:cysteine synthase
MPRVHEIALEEGIFVGNSAGAAIKGYAIKDHLSQKM